MNGGMAARSSDESTSTPSHCATSLSCSVRQRPRSAASRANRMAMAWRSGRARPPTQLSGWFSPVSPSISARATMPCLNSSGNVASEPSSTPSARRPFQVKATVTQRLSCSTEAMTSATDCAFSRIAESQARPPAALRNERNSYRPVSAGVRVSRMCWMSSFSSIACLRWKSLHLVEHVREGRLELQGLLDLVRTHERIFAIFKEARAMMVTDELDECRGVRFPIFRKALQILENGAETGCRKDANRILGIFVEVGVENAHVLEIGFPLDVEKVPSEVMQLEHSEDVRLISDGLLNVLGVLIKNRLPSGDNLRDNGEAVASRSLGKDRAVSALLNFILGEAPFGDRHGRGFRPALPRRVRHNFVLSI